MAWGHPSYQFSGSSHPFIHIFNLQIQSYLQDFWGGTWRCISYRYLAGMKLWTRHHLRLTFPINATSTTDFICAHIFWEQPCIQQHAWGIHQNTIGLLTPRSLPGQMPHADLGALPTFLVYRYTIRLPGVRDLQTNTEEKETWSETSIHTWSGSGVCNRDAVARSLTVWFCWRQCCRTTYDGKSAAAPCWSWKQEKYTHYYWAWC